MFSLNVKCDVNERIKRVVISFKLQLYAVPCLHGYSRGPKDNVFAKDVLIPLVIIFVIQIHCGQQVSPNAIIFTVFAAVGAATAIYWRVWTTALAAEDFKVGWFVIAAQLFNVAGQLVIVQQEQGCLQEFGNVSNFYT